MKYEVRLVPKDEALAIESVIKSRKINNKNNGKRMKMNGSILTNEEYNEQVESFETKETTAKKKKGR